MKYLSIIITIAFFCSCNTQNDNLSPPDTTCYFNITLNDSLSTCFNTNYVVGTNWGYGTYQIANKTQYTTSTFEHPSGYSHGITLTNNEQCNNITVEFYAENVLVETQNIVIGYQNDCQTYCDDGIITTLTFTVP